MNNKTKASVIKIDEKDPKLFVIDKGSIDGIAQDDIFLLYGISEESIISPITGEDLGKLEIIRGRAKVSHLQETITTLVSLEKKQTFVDQYSTLRVHRHLLNEPEYESIPLAGLSIGDCAKVVDRADSFNLSSIDISVFEREITTEYMRLFGHEIAPEYRSATTQIVNVASTAAAIAVKLFVEKYSSGEIIDGGTF